MLKKQTFFTLIGLLILLSLVLPRGIYAQVVPDSINEYAFNSSPNGGVFRVDDNEALDVTGDFTIEAWVYINEDETSSRFIIDRADEWQFYIISASVRFDLQETADLITSGVLSLNEWHHVAVIRKGDRTSIYADGVKTASGNLAMSSGITPCVVGGQDSWFSIARTSLIDEVKFSKAAIYDTAGFTPSATAPLGTDENTVFYFQFEDSTELPPLDDGPLTLATSDGQTDGTNLIEAGNYVAVPAGLPLNPGTAITEEHNMVRTFFLEQNYPNPFNPTTLIKYHIPNFEFVTLEVYNALGQRVTLLINKRMNAGSHEVQYNASDLPSGIYFYRIQAGEFSQVKKMVLLR